MHNEWKLTNKFLIKKLAVHVKYVMVLINIFKITAK